MATAKKATTPAKTEKPKAEPTRITTTKTGSCRTLNGQSKLEYALGRNDKGELHYRITKNNGGGFYSDEWLPFDGIKSALSKTTPITSAPLRALSIGKSVNTSGFLMAVLLAEGVVERIPGKTKHFQFPGAKGAAISTKAAPKKSPAKRPAKTATAKQR